MSTRIPRRGPYRRAVPAAHLLAETIGQLQGRLTCQGRVQFRTCPQRRGPGHQVRYQVRDPGRGLRVRIAAEVVRPDAIQNRADHELLQRRILIR
jgi:hypothetical protein